MAHVYNLFIGFHEPFMGEPTKFNHCSLFVDFMGSLLQLNIPDDCKSMVNSGLSKDA